MSPEVHEIRLGRVDEGEDGIDRQWSNVTASPSYADLDVMGKTITPTVPQRPSKHSPLNRQPLSFTIIGQQKNLKQKSPTLPLLPTNHRRPLFQLQPPTMERTAATVPSASSPIHHTHALVLPIRN
jgi:hypothetical protein